MFLHDTPKDWALQVHMYTYAHTSQPISELNISPHEIVFHTRPRIPLTFDLHLTKICNSRYCSQLPEPSHYDKTDPKPFFYRTLSKPITQWSLQKLQCYKYTPPYMKTPHERLTHTLTILEHIMKENHFLLVLLF